MRKSRPGRTTKSRTEGKFRVHRMPDLIASVKGMEIAEAARSLTGGSSSRRSWACETAAGPRRGTAADAQFFGERIAVRTRIGRYRFGIPLCQFTRLSCAVPRGETRTRRRAEAHRADPQAATAGDRGRPAGRRRGRYRGACRSRSGGAGRPPYDHHGRCPGMSSYAVRWPGRGGLTIHGSTPERFGVVARSGLGSSDFGTAYRSTGEVGTRFGCRSPCP